MIESMKEIKHLKVNKTEIERIKELIKKEKDELMRDVRIVRHVEKTNHRLRLIQSRRELIKILENKLNNI